MPFNQKLDASSFDEQTLIVWQEQVNLLQGLLQHPGWKLIEFRLQQMEHAAMQQGVNASDASTIARSFGILHAASEIRKYPQREFEALKERLLAEQNTTKTES